MGYGTNKGKKYKKDKRMSKEEIELIFKLYNEKMDKNRKCR
jgi:hypothetical protein